MAFLFFGAFSFLWPFSFFIFLFLTWDNGLENEDHHTSIYLQLNDYNSILRTKYDSIWVPPAVYRDCDESSVTCMKNYGRWLCHKYDVNYSGSPYVHATRITNFNTSVSQIHNYSTSMTIISPSSYLKTIIKYQTSHSIQCTLYGSFYHIPLGCPSY